MFTWKSSTFWKPNFKKSIIIYVQDLLLLRLQFWSIVKLFFTQKICEHQGLQEKKNLCKQKCDILTENGGFKLYPLPVFDIDWFFSHSEPKFKLFKFRIWRRKNKMWILQCYLFHGSWKPRKHKLPRYGILLHNLWLDFIIFWTI